MELRGSCNGCGACCKVLVLEQSPEEVRQMAALTRVLGIPSDHIFAAKHWHPLTREEAMRLNPFYTSRVRADAQDRKSTRLNSSHSQISYAVFCLKKKKKNHTPKNYIKKIKQCQRK